MLFHYGKYNRGDKRRRKFQQIRVILASSTSDMETTSSRKHVTILPRLPTYRASIAIYLQQLFIGDNNASLEPNSNAVYILSRISVFVLDGSSCILTPGALQMSIPIDWSQYLRQPACRKLSASSSESIPRAYMRICLFPQPLHTLASNRDPSP